MKKIVSFRRMEDGTREDYLLLDRSEREYAAGLPDRVLHALRQLGTSLDAYPVSRLEHSLQVATRAEAAGADEELVLGALLHDIGDELAPYNHAEVAAGIIRPYVRPKSPGSSSSMVSSRPTTTSTISAATGSCATG
jgi:predicted HD phosphohydrolase